MKHLGTKELETNRLVLRQMQESDAEGIYNSFINEEKFLYYTNKEKRTFEEEKESLKGIQEKYKSNEYYNWLITLKDKTIIGYISFNVDNYNESVEFNYAIDEKHQNNGYMTEALQKIKDYALKEMNVNRFYGGCEINNKASQRVMEKCHLSFEGILKKHLKLKDGYHNMLVYASVNNKLSENRIEANEEKLDCLLNITQRLELDLNELERNQNKLKELNDYYGSEDWFKDLEGNHNGVKAGVLSEDAVWNLNEKIIDLINQIEDIKDNINSEKE